MQIALVYITHDSKEHASTFGQQIVSRKLAACYNAFPIQSMFWWKESLETADEWVTVFKTSVNHLPKLRRACHELHPYEVPCIMSWEVEVNNDYGNWVLESLS